MHLHFQGFLLLQNLSFYSPKMIQAIIYDGITSYSFSPQQSCIYVRTQVVWAIELVPLSLL